MGSSGFSLVGAPWWRRNPWTVALQWCIGQDPWPATQLDLGSVLWFQLWWLLALVVSLGVVCLVCKWALVGHGVRHPVLEDVDEDGGAHRGSHSGSEYGGGDDFMAGLASSPGSRTSRRDTESYSRQRRDTVDGRKTAEYNGDRHIKELGNRNHQSDNDQEAERHDPIANSSPWICRALGRTVFLRESKQERNCGSYLVLACVFVTTMLSFLCFVTYSENEAVSRERFLEMLHMFEDLQRQQWPREDKRTGNLISTYTKMRAWLDGENEDESAPSAAAAATTAAGASTEVPPSAPAIASQTTARSLAPAAGPAIGAQSAAERDEAMPPTQTHWTAEMSEDDAARLNRADKAVQEKLEQAPKIRIALQTGERREDVARVFAFVSRQTVQGVLMRTRTNNAIITQSSLIQQMLSEWASRKMDGARVLEMYLASPWCDSRWEPRRVGPCQLRGGDTSPRRSSSQAVLQNIRVPATVEEMKRQHLSVVSVEHPDERGRGLHFHETNKRPVSGAVNQWEAESAWLEDKNRPALRENWLGYFYASQDENFMVDDPLEDEAKKLIRVDLIGYEGMSKENLYERCLDAFEDALRAALQSIEALPGSDSWTLSALELAERVWSKRAWTFVYLPERREYIRCETTADNDEPHVVPDLPAVDPASLPPSPHRPRTPRGKSDGSPPPLPPPFLSPLSNTRQSGSGSTGGEATTASQRVSNPVRGAASSPRDSSAAPADTCFTQESAFEAGSFLQQRQAAGEDYRSAGGSSRGDGEFLDAAEPEGDQEVIVSPLGEVTVLPVNQSRTALLGVSSSGSASARSRLVPPAPTTSARQDTADCGDKTSALAASAGGSSSLLSIQIETVGGAWSPEDEDDIASDEPPSGCTRWDLDVEPPAAAFAVAQSSRLCEPEQEGKDRVIPKSHTVRVTKWELHLYLMRQDYRRFFLGEGDKVQEPTLFSIYNLRIIWAWLNLATFVVFGLRFVMRLLTARHVDPQMYPKGAFSYLACHWSAWLEMLVILPGIFFSFLQSQHTRRDLEARHLIHGTKEVIPGYFLLFFVDLADCYLILRGNSPKLLLQVYLTISRPYGYALLLLVGAWVTVAGGYWITAIGQEMAPSIGSKYSDSNLQPDKDAANFHQTKFQSMADAMYHVFVNFNGEYPLGADHLTFWSRFWALTSVFVGVLLLTIPVGIFSKALQKVIEEGQKEQAGASSLDDQEDPGVLPNGAAGGRVIDENGRMIDEQRRGRGEGDGDNDDFNTCMRFRRPQAFSDASTIVPGGPPPREPGAPSQEASGPSLAPTQSPDASLSVNGVSASVLSGQAGGLHPDVAGSPLSAGTLPSTVGDTNISVAVAPGGLVNSSMAQTASTDMPEGARAVTALYEDLLITEEEERVSPREGDLQDETALRLLPRIVEGRRMFRDDRNVPEHTGEQPTIVGEKMETVLEQTERLCAMEEERILLQQDYSNNDLNLMESFEEQGEFPEMATLRPFRFGCCQRVGSVVVRKWFIHVAALLGVASIVNYIIFDHFQGEALYVYAEDAARAQRKCKFWNWNWLCGKVERSHRYSRWSRGEQVSALHGDHLALFNTLLAIEGACTLFFLCEYILRIIDNNWHDRLLACRVARRLELPTPRYEVETQCHYLFTSWGLIDLLSWLPSTVMLSLFLVESAQGHTCGGAAGERTGCVDLTKDWIWYFYGLCCVRALKWERVIYAFASIRKILNDYLLLYEYFLVLSFSLMAMFSVIIHVTEANNPDADQRFQVMSYPRALWMVVLTLNGESPWADYTYMGRVLHVLMMLLAVPIFAVPCGLFANAFHRYLGQVEDTPDEDDGYPSAFESSSGSFKNLDEVAGVEKDLRNGASDDRDGAQDSGAANLDERSGYNNKSVAFRAAEATRSRAQMRSMRQHSNATSAMIGQSATNLGVGPGKERKTRDLDEPLDYEEYLGDETKKANRQLSKAPADGLKSLQRAFNRFGSRSRVVRQSGTSNWNPDAPVPGGSRSRSKPAAFSSMQVSRNPRNNDDDDAALVPQFLHAESAPASAGHSKSKVFDPSGDQEAKDDTLAPLLGARGESTAAGPRTFDEVFGIDEDDLAARARRKSIAASRGVRIAESATITTYEKSGIDSGVTESPEFVPNRLTAGTFEPGEDVIAAATSGGLKLSSRRSSVDVTAEELAGDWEGIFPGEAKRRNSTPTPRETAYSYNLPDTGTTTAEVAMSKKSNLITGLKRRMEEEEQRRAKIYPPASKTFRRLHRIIWCPDHVLLTRKSEHCWATLRRFFTLLALPFLFFNSIYYSMHHCCAVWHYGRLENWSEYVSTFRLNERTRIEMLSYHNHLRHVIELISVRRLSPDTAGGAKWQMQQRAEIQLASVRAAASNSNANVYESDHDQAPAPSPSGASPSLLSQLSFSSASGGSTGASGPQPQAPRLFRSYPAALETNVKPPDMLFFQRFLVQNYVGSDDALIHCEGKDDGDVELDDTEFPSGEIDLDHARLTIPTFLPLYLGSDPEIDRTLLEKGKYLDYLDAVETRAQKLCKDIGAEYKPNDVESRAITELQARYLIIERKPGWADNDRGVPWSERQQYLGGRLVSRWQALAEYDEYLAGYESFGGIGERVRTQSWYDWVRQTLFGRNMQWFPTYLVAIDVFTFVVFLIDYILILLSTSKRMWYLTSVAGVCHLLGLVGLLGTLIVRAAAPAAFFNVYADLVYKTRGGFASYFMLASLSCRMFMVGYLDNLYPSIRMVADCVWRYKREMIQSVYIVIVVWLFASATFHLTEKENFGTQKDSGKTSTWRSIDDQGEDNELRRNLKPVNYSRYYTLLNTFQLVMIHLTGDYPITEYTNVGRVCHVLLMAAAAGFLAVPTGLFVAVYAQQLKLTRAATMHLARRFAAVRLQRQWRGVLARRKFRRLIQTARRNRDIVMEVRPSCFEKFAEWCLSLVSPRPWQVTRCGYYYQWIMIGLHLFASILGIVLSTRPLQWVTVPDEDAARISDTSFTRTAVALWYVILGAQILFFVEYLLRLVAARAMPQMNFSMWRMFTKSASLLDLTLFCVYIVANVVIYLDVKDYTNDPDAFEQGGRQPLLKPTINEAGSDRGKPEVPISNWMEAVIWERTGNFVLVLHVWRVLHGMFFADWSLHVSGYLATQQLMANAGILALFIFLIGGTMWWLCERHYQNEFDSLWSAIYGGSIFLLSEWFVCDFQVAGKILCIFYCVAGVGMFGIATGAIYDGLGEGLSQFVEYRRHVKWSMLKEEYHARELEAREHARQILDGSEAYHAGEQRARVTHLLLSTSEEEQQPTRKH